MTPGYQTRMSTTVSMPLSMNGFVQSSELALDTPDQGVETWLSEPEQTSTPWQHPIEDSYALVDRTPVRKQEGPTKQVERESLPVREEEGEPEGTRLHSFIGWEFLAADLMFHKPVTGILLALGIAAVPNIINYLSGVYFATRNATSKDEFRESLPGRDALLYFPRRRMFFAGSLFAVSLAGTVFLKYPGQFIDAERAQIAETDQTAYRYATYHPHRGDGVINWFREVMFEDEAQADSAKLKLRHHIRDLADSGTPEDVAALRFLVDEYRHLDTDYNLEWVGMEALQALISIDSIESTKALVEIAFNENLDLEAAKGDNRDYDYSKDCLKEVIERKPEDAETLALIDRMLEMYPGKRWSEAIGLFPEGHDFEMAFKAALNSTYTTKYDYELALRVYKTPQGFMRGIIENGLDFDSFYEASSGDHVTPNYSLFFSRYNLTEEDYEYLLFNDRLPASFKVAALKLCFEDCDTALSHDLFKRAIKYVRQYNDRDKDQYKEAILAYPTYDDIMHDLITSRALTDNIKAELFKKHTIPEEYETRIIDAASNGDAKLYLQYVVKDKSPEEKNQFVQKVQKSKNRNTWNGAILATMHNKYFETYQYELAVSVIASDGSNSVRVTACNVLGASGSPENWRRLHRIVSDRSEDDSVRIAAFKSLHKYKRPGWERYVPMIRDEREDDSFRGKLSKIVYSGER